MNGQARGQCYWIAVLVAAAAAAACANVATGDPERDQARAIAVNRQAAVIAGAREAAKQREDCKAEDDEDDEDDERCAAETPQD